jgi:sec-independent protein translocase protein TatC
VWKDEQGGQGEEPGWLDKLLGRGKPAAEAKEGEVVVTRDDLVVLYVTRLEPVREVAYVQEAEQRIGKRPALTTLSIQEAFMVYFKVSMVCGVVIGSPWIFWQIWSFIAAGLYPHEKRYVHVYLPFSLCLFLAGVFLCEFFVIPKAIEALLWFNEWIGLEPDLRLNEWLGFAILMPLVFGVSFQTPLVMLFLERLGIMDVESYQNKRRMAWFIMAIFAALITPSTDAISMLFLWLPMSLLFELGIIMCKMSPRQPDFGLELPDSEEMVEV